MCICVCMISRCVCICMCVISRCVCMCMCVISRCVCMHACACSCTGSSGPQRTTCGSWFSSSTMWSQALNSGRWAWWQASLLSKPSCQPKPAVPLAQLVKSKLLKWRLSRSKGSVEPGQAPARKRTWSCHKFSSLGPATRSQVFQ